MPPHEHLSLHAFLHQLIGQILQDDMVSGCRAGLGDTLTHGARSDKTYCVDLHCILPVFSKEKRRQDYTGFSSEYGRPMAPPADASKRESHSGRIRA